MEFPWKIAISPGFSSETFGILAYVSCKKTPLNGDLNDKNEGPKASRLKGRTFQSPFQAATSPKDRNTEYLEMMGVRFIVMKSVEP